MKDEKRHIHPAGMLIVLVVILVVSILFSVMAGRYGISLIDVLKAFTGQEVTTQISQIIFKVRLPRIFASVLVGGALAVSGAAYQGMFKNPLVSPDLLGASAGSAFGAILGIMMGIGLVGMKSMAFFFGLVAVLVTWFVGTKVGKGSNTNLLLVLAGILVGGLFSSLMTLMKYVADTNTQLPEITFWLMGSMNKATYTDVISMLVPFGACFLVMLYIGNKINILSLGEEEAKSLGVNTRVLQIVIIVVATVLTSYSISITGTISWVGLVVPHFVRMLVGPNFKYLIPGSILLGGAYLLLMDDLCRSLLTVEIPLGIATSLVGIPFIIFLMRRKGSAW